MGQRMVVGRVVLLCVLVGRPAFGPVASGDDPEAKAVRDGTPAGTAHVGADREADARETGSPVARASDKIQTDLDAAWAEPPGEGRARDPWDFARHFLATIYDMDEARQGSFQLTSHHAVEFFHDQLCMRNNGGKWFRCRFGRDGEACTHGLASTRALEVDWAPALRMPVGAGQVATERRHTIAVREASVIRAVSGAPLPGDGTGGDDAIGETCVRLAVQILVYRGPGGVRTRWVGLDDTPGDGFAFEVDLAAFPLADTDVVGLVELWLDHEGAVANGFDHVLIIEAPGGAGDWNRDSAVTRADLAGFMNAARRRLPRADRNGDGRHDQDDMILFMAAYAGGE